MVLKTPLEGNDGRFPFAAGKWAGPSAVIAIIAGG